MKVTAQRITGRATSFDAIALSWDSAPGAATYHVEMRKASDSAFSKVYEGSSLSHAVTGLEPSTKYLFRMRPVSAGGGTVSEWGKEIEVKTQEVLVPVPTNVTASAVSWNTVGVSWSPVPAECASYRVFVVERAGSVSRSWTVDCGQNTQYRLSGLQPATKYSFCVQAG